MKTVAGPRAAKIGAGRTGGGLIERGDFGLGADGTEREERVLVRNGFQDAPGIDGLGAVDGDEIVFAIGDALEFIHPVDRHRVGAAEGIAREGIIPRGPR